MERISKDRCGYSGYTCKGMPPLRLFQYLMSVVPGNDSPDIYRRRYTPPEKTCEAVPVGDLNTYLYASMLPRKVKILDPEAIPYDLQFNISSAGSAQSQLCQRNFDPTQPVFQDFFNVLETVKIILEYDQNNNPIVRDIPADYENNCYYCRENQLVTQRQHTPGILQPLSVSLEKVPPIQQPDARQPYIPSSQSSDNMQAIAITAAANVTTPPTDTSPCNQPFYVKASGALVNNQALALINKTKWQRMLDPDGPAKVIAEVVTGGNVYISDPFFIRHPINGDTQRHFSAAIADDGLIKKEFTLPVNTYKVFYMDIQKGALVSGLGQPKYRYNIHAGDHHLQQSQSSSGSMGSDTVWKERITKRLGSVTFHCQQITIDTIKNMYTDAIGAIMFQTLVREQDGPFHSCYVKVVREHCGDVYVNATEFSGEEYPGIDSGSKTLKPVNCGTTTEQSDSSKARLPLITKGSVTSSVPAAEALSALVCKDGEFFWMPIQACQQTSS